MTPNNDADTELTIEVDTIGWLVIRGKVDGVTVNGIIPFPEHFIAAVEKAVWTWVQGIRTEIAEADRREARGTMSKHTGAKKYPGAN